jgi:hypothetical protein
MFAVFGTFLATVITAVFLFLVSLFAVDGVNSTGVLNLLLSHIPSRKALLLVLSYQQQIQVCKSNLP